MVRINSKRKINNMNRVLIILLNLFLIFLVTTKAWSENNNIYEKIDLFGEVLNKINK